MLRSICILNSPLYAFMYRIVLCAYIYIATITICHNIGSHVDVTIEPLEIGDYINKQKST